MRQREQGTNAGHDPATDAERRARMGLTVVAEPGDPTLTRAVERDGAVAAWQSILAGDHGTGLADQAARFDAGDMRGEIGGDIRFVIPGDDEWPRRLDDLADLEPIQRRAGMPHGLWLRGQGQLDDLLRRSVAMIGSRASSVYGDHVANEISFGLAGAGCTVVSGGGFGIDAAAHRGALAASGPTIAVLGCGLDVCYPGGNTDLFYAIARDHLLVSELPPGTHPTRTRFLARNRLIAALTSSTVVVEAAIRSGARYTAAWASACGRPVMAVPGSIDSTLSATPHQMIRSGQATMVTSVDDILDTLRGASHSAPSQGVSAPA